MRINLDRVLAFGAADQGVGERIPRDLALVPAKRPVWREWGYYIRYDRPERVDESSRERKNRLKRGGRPGRVPVGVAVVVTPSVDRKLALSWRWELATSAVLTPQAFFREFFSVVFVALCLVWLAVSSVLSVPLLLVVGGVVPMGALAAWVVRLCCPRIRDSVFGEGSTHEAIHVLLDSSESRSKDLVLALDGLVFGVHTGQVSREEFTVVRERTWRELVELSTPQASVVGV